MNPNAFIGEIAIYAGDLDLKNNPGWLPCDGRMLQIGGNYDTLFSLIGNKFGGDGQTTFALPDLRGRVPMHAGTRPGLTTRNFGQPGGNPEVMMTLNQMPLHTHQLTNPKGGTIMASGNPGNTSAPDATNNTIAAASDTATGAPNHVYNSSAPDVEWDTDIRPTNVSNTGGGQPFPVMQPGTVIGYYICCNGIYPSPQ